MQGITPFLWFDNQAEEAVNRYVSIFSEFRGSQPGGKESKVLSIQPIPGGPAKGNVIATFLLDGQKFMAIDGGPMFKFSPAISFIIHCETQEEVDYLWEKLSEGGQTQQCGWLSDKYGVSWQITPTALDRLMEGGDAARSERVMTALLQMTKIDIAALEEAYRQE